MMIPTDPILPTPTLNEDDEIATYCDRCGKALPFGPTAIMRDTGRTIDNLPVIEIICFDCAGYTEETAPTLTKVFVTDGEKRAETKEEPKK
jgi:hypothetical protein